MRVLHVHVYKTCIHVNDTCTACMTLVIYMGLNNISKLRQEVSLGISPFLFILHIWNNDILPTCMVYEIIGKK